jgi:hypothetical protein
MKRCMITLLMATMAINSLFAMDYETARERAYYLTDKMAYELNLNDEQYNNAYEINLDYLLSLTTADDLQAEYLAYRNADLRSILYDWQWKAFIAIDYLFRPVWWLNGMWHFPVFSRYAHTHYFYHRPSIYWDYRGGHGRIHYAHGYYNGRRPQWHGGLRGMNRDLLGHPNPRGGRYGDQHHRPHIEHRGGMGRGYHFDRGGHDRGHHFGNNGRGNNNHGNNNRGGGYGFERGNNNHGSHPDMGGSRPDNGGSRPDIDGSRPNVDGHGSSNSFSRGNGFSGSRNSFSGSRGSSMNSSSRTTISRGSNFSGSRSSFSGSRSNFSGSRGGFSGGRGGEHRGRR